MAYVLYDAMDYVLYDAVTKDDIDVLKEMEECLSVADQLTPTKNTVLHLACQYGSIKCMEHILSVHKSLLLKINSGGETALHLAAREGHYEVVVALTDAAKSSLLQTQATLTLTVIQLLIRKINKEKETALHNAVRYNHKEVVQLLVNEDPSHSHPRNKYDETPLYLASIECYTDIMRTILDNCESPQFGGPNGRTALHAALLNDGGHECVKLLLEKAKDLIKVADKYGWTAFHYVAYNDLYNIVEDLVRAAYQGNVNVGYAVDRLKRTALHVAAYQGNVNVMKKLVEYYPDSWEIVDRRGKNVLHIAVEQDRKETIRFILSQAGCKASNNILIQRDNGGNTPLHLIAKLGCYVQELMDARGCDWNVLNNEGFTPLDILDNGRTDTLVGDQAMVRTTLIQAKAKRQYLPLQNMKMYKKEDATTYAEIIKKGINTHIVVAALITTVALTAGFAMPGGFDGNKGSTQGSPMLLRKTAFQAFIVTDAITLLLSISSIFLYFWTLLIIDNIELILKLFVVSTMLNLVSITSMMLAFITGTYAVLAHSVALASTVFVISSLFFFVVYYVLLYFIFHKPLVSLFFKK